MLDGIDKAQLNNLVEECARLKKGFFCVVGPSNLFSYAIKELNNQFKIKEGIPGGKEIDMQTIDAYDVDWLADAPPPVFYFVGFADTQVWEKIKIRRSRFIAKKKPPATSKTKPQYSLLRLVSIEISSSDAILIMEL